MHSYALSCYNHYCVNHGLSFIYIIYWYQYNILYLSYHITSKGSMFDSLKLSAPMKTLVIVSHAYLFLFLKRSLSDCLYDTKYCGKPHEPFSKQMAANHTFKELLSSCRLPFKKVRVNVYCQ